MEWREVVEHPDLRNLPFKIETNEWGKILMTPISGTHELYQSEIGRLLKRLEKGGRTSMECPIQTSQGVKVADIVWASTAFLQKHGARILLFPESPEVVVEVQSTSNFAAEMEEKKLLYFEAGAKELWLCDDEGNMRFLNPEGELERSQVFGDFPKHIDIEME